MAGRLDIYLANMVPGIRGALKGQWLQQCAEEQCDSFLDVEANLLCQKGGVKGRALTGLDSFSVPYS